MGDTASSNRPAPPSPSPIDGGAPHDVDLPSTARPAPPIRDDQPTVISHGVPASAASVSDSAYRFLQGKIAPGDRLGHFELVGYVGGGGMGRVFRAVDTRLARTVALKVLPPDQATERETLLRFHKEAQSAARLDHENIGRVYHLGEDRGLHFIVFEFIEGVNVRTLVEQKGPLSPAEAVSYALQIAEALAHAADRDVVHRDIKPSNVLITPEGQVKLIDMGLARVQRDDTSAADLTASGVTLGTFDYISPEQARDPRNADVRSDIYSLGCTFFYMLTGRPPFPEGTVLQKLLQHQGDQPPDVRRFRPELPEEAARVLRKMLAKDPRHRYRGAGELVEDLLALAEQVGLRPVGPFGQVFLVPREPKVSFLHRHLPWIAPIAALFCIVASLHIYWSFSAKQTTQLAPRSVVQRPTSGEAPDPEKSPSPIAPAEEPGPAADHPGQSPPETPRAEGPKPSEPPGAVGPTPESKPNDTPKPDHDRPPPDATPTAEPTDLGWPGPPNPFFNSSPGTEGLTVEPHSGLTVSGEGGGMSAAEIAAGVLSVVPPDRLTGGTGAATEPAEIGPSPEPMRRRRGALIVSEDVAGRNEFRTLSAACRQAADGDVIELRYQGRHEERPISLANVNVEIQAGEGYHPVIVFRPGKDEIDPVKYPRSMFTMTAGSLKLVNLALELYVPREIPAEKWSLFETRGGQAVRLEKCSLSIINASDDLMAYQKEVAFFRAKLGREIETLTGDDGSAALPHATIDLGDCIARGEAVFLCAEDMQPVRFGWKNGLLVTSERLLSARGGWQVSQPEAMFEVDLRHVTAVVHGGFCRLIDDQPASRRLNARIHCSDSIVMAAPGAPLIEQLGAAALDDLRPQIAWSGEGNFYEGFDVFWTICRLDQEPLSDPLTFESWKRHWTNQTEKLPTLDGVGWERLPEATRPLHTHSPADYALRESTAEAPNPAVDAAGVDRDAGFQANQLPELPPEPVAEEPALAAPAD